MRAAPCMLVSAPIWSKCLSGICSKLLPHLEYSEEVRAEEHVVLQNDGMGVTLLLKQPAEPPPVMLRQPCMPRLQTGALPLHMALCHPIRDA